MAHYSQQAPMLYARFAKHLDNLWKPPRSAAIAVGLSGGLDSVALLMLLHRYCYHRRTDVKLIAAHLNHGIRGQEGDRDQAFCEQLCTSLGIEFYTQKHCTPSLADEKSLSIETAARELRLKFFLELTQKHACGAICVAHHQDDQVETVLAHLLRGCSYSGLQGMAAKQSLFLESHFLSQQHDAQFRSNSNTLLLRPLLAFKRDELQEYVQQEGLGFCEDSTNSDLQYRRNKVRHELIPELETNYSPQFRKHIVALSEEACELKEWQSELLSPYLEHAVFTSNGVVFPKEHLPESPVLGRALLDFLWEKLTGQRKSLCRNHYDSWQAISKGLAGKHYDFPERYSLERAGKHMHLFKKPRAKAYRWESTGLEPESAEVLTRWAIAGELECSWQREAEPGRGHGTSLQLRPVAASDKILIRKQKGEDSSEGHKKVTASLKEAGIPSFLLKHWPVLVESQEAKGERVLWIPGLRKAAGDSHSSLSFTRLLLKPGSPLVKLLTALHIKFELSEDS